MALRTRPLKFSIWQATHIQKRSCRSPFQTRVIDHGTFQRQFTLPQRLTEGSAPPVIESKICQQLPENSHRPEQVSVVPYHWRETNLQPWKCKSVGLKTSGPDDITPFSDLVQPQINKYDIIPENHITGILKDASWTYTGQCLCPYVYTADDMLFDRKNTFVNSATMQVDPFLVTEFFKHRSVPLQDKSKNVDTKPCTPLQKSTPTASACFESIEPADSDNSVASDFVNFMEYFMNGAFALERLEESNYSSVVTKEDQPLTGLQPASEASGVVYYSDLTSSHGGAKKPTPGNQNKPSLQQLINMQDYLSEAIPKIFVKRHEYRIYKQDVIFENNYFAKPYVTIGLNNYAMQVAKLRIMAHFRFANVRIHVLKITVHEEDGTVRVRWRLSGIPQSRAFMFWKFLPWRYKEKVNKESEWHDGISTFYLDGHGMIGKHRMDRMIPEEEVLVKKEAVIEDTLNPGLVA